MWASVAVTGTVIVAIAYFVAGLVLCCVIRRPIAIAFPALSTLYGGVFGFIISGIGAAVIAQIYIAGEFSLDIYTAVIWGVGLAAMVILFAFGRFAFLY